MRVSVCLFLTAAFVGGTSTAAFSRDVKISGTHNVSNIEIHCIDNGGTFFNAPGGGYGCAGSGGGTVTCTAKGKCTGTVSKVAGGGGNGPKGGVHPVQVIAPNKPIANAGPNGGSGPGRGGGMAGSGMASGGMGGGGKTSGSSRR
jgi:hypothetical protein